MTSASFVSKFKARWGESPNFSGPVLDQLLEWIEDLMDERYAAGCRDGEEEAEGRNNESSYDDGFREGWEEGYEEGRREGYEDGFRAGRMGP